MKCCQKLIWFFFPFATALATHYECFPYPVKSVCRIEYISYHPGDQISFPVGYEQYHIQQPTSRRTASSNVTIFDHQLYEAMHRPTSIEMAGTELRQLSLPTKLLLGDFHDNQIKSVNTSNGDIFNITYLDLSYNQISSIDFVSPLANLEILHLEYNNIEVISGSALSKLTKLKYLYLHHNLHITSFPWSDIPRSIIHLDFYWDNIKEMTITNVSLPALEYLNIQHNDLSTFNVTELLRVAPNLKEVHPYNDGFSVDFMGKIYAQLKANNVSFEKPSHGCEDDEKYEMSSGACIRWIPRDESWKSPMRIILMSLVAIGTAFIFVCVLLLVFKHMNR